MAAAAPAASGGGGGGGGGGGAMGGAGGNTAAPNNSAPPLKTNPDLRALLIPDFSGGKQPLFIIKSRITAQNTLGSALYDFPNSAAAKNAKAAATARCVPFFQQYILIDHDILANPKPGYYTWLIKDFGVNGSHLLLSRVYSHQEVGTLHLNIDNLSAPGRVVIAGELQIALGKDGKLYFIYNTQSGSYTLKLMSGKSIDSEDKRVELVTDIYARSQLMTSILSALGVPSGQIIPKFSVDANGKLLELLGVISKLPKITKLTDSILEKLDSYEGGTEYLKSQQILELVPREELMLSNKMREKYMTECGLVRKAQGGGARRSRKSRKSRRRRTSKKLRR
jgi:hypothetical protein